MRSKFAFTSWSRDPLFEGQQLQNGQISALSYAANIDQSKILFPLTPNLIGFVNKNFLPTASHGYVLADISKKSTL